jgi:hypothetical protein
LPATTTSTRSRASARSNFHAARHMATGYRARALIRLRVRTKSARAMSILGLSYSERKEGRLVFSLLRASKDRPRPRTFGCQMVPYHWCRGTTARNPDFFFFAMFVRGSSVPRTYMTVQSWMSVCLGLGSAPGTAVIFASQRCLT